MGSWWEGKVCGEGGGDLERVELCWTVWCVLSSLRSDVECLTASIAIQFAKLSGFSPIITTASKHNEEYCKAAGATHVLDYHDVPLSELPNVVAKITGDTPLTLVYNATSDIESHKIGWDMLAENGTEVIVNPPSDAVANKRGKEDEKGRRVVWAFGVANDPDHWEFGKGLYAALTEFLEKGEIKVC